MTATLTAGPETTAAAVPGGWRRFVPGAAMIIGGLYAIWAFGLGSRTDDGAKAHFNFNLVGGGAAHVPNLVITAEPVAITLGVLCVLVGAARLFLDPNAKVGISVKVRIWTLTAYLVFFVLAFLIWGTTGKQNELNVASLLNATVLAAVPLVLGALAGLICERSGVINVAIEGQLLAGAWAAAYTASTTGSLWAGLIAGCVAGGLWGALLAVFANRYLVLQVVLGVVLNVLAAGLTGFLYERIMQEDPNANKAVSFSNIKIPLLSKIPLVGPVLFNQNIIFYITIVLIVVVHVALFHTRWGLRTRAVGEHPTAADTVGIKVIATRYRNVIGAGFIAGLGGVWLTIGLSIPFAKNMSSGKGFIALAAVIFGRWSPIGALSAALLFGFADAISTSLQPLGTPVPTNFLQMTPYLATIFAVAGLVGHVRAPAAEGVPYTKS